MSQIGGVGTLRLIFKVLTGSERAKTGVEFKEIYKGKKMAKAGCQEAVKELWRSNLPTLTKRVLIVYLVMALCRAVFYIYNRGTIGAIPAEEMWSLFKGALLFDSVSIIYAYPIFIIVSIIPLSPKARENRWYRRGLFWYFSVVTALVAALNIADVVYFRYTGVRLTAADVIFTENQNSIKLALQFALENYYLVLIWVAICVGAIWLYKYTYPRSRYQIKNGWLYYTRSMVILICVSLISVAVVRGGGLSRTIRPIHLNNSMRYTTSQERANMILSNPFCLIRTMSNKGVKYTKYFSEQELDSIYTPYHYPAGWLEGGATSQSPVWLTTERRNVVIFILESFSAEHSAQLNPDLYPAGEGFTPFIDSLMRGGYYSLHSYSSGMKSIDALPSILGSIPAYKKPFITIPQGMGIGRQLPKILAEDGAYSTLFFCGSPSGSMGFDAYASLAGVKQIYEKEDYNEARPGSRDFDGFWGVWDDPFIDYSGEVLSRTEEPFISTLFTVTSHHPFNVPSEYKETLPVGTTKAHQSVAYTDMAIRNFFDKYGTQEWFQRTIFIFCADHISSERFSPKYETSVGKRRIISLIYTPDGSVSGIDRGLFQQIDIMPTTLGLLGYNRPYFAFGRDVFNEPNPMSIHYDQLFQIVTDSLVMRHDEERVTEVFELSDSLMQHNIASPSSEAQQQIERRLKGAIQQYYRHIERGIYLVPEDEWRIKERE